MSWNQKRVLEFVKQLRGKGYHVEAFPFGYASEVDGTQIFRATQTGVECYDVKINREVVLDI